MTVFNHSYASVCVVWSGWKDGWMRMYWRGEGGCGMAERKLMHGLNPDWVSSKLPLAVSWSAGAWLWREQFIFSGAWRYIAARGGSLKGGEADIQLHFMNSASSIKKNKTSTLYTHTHTKKKRSWYLVIRCDFVSKLRVISPLLGQRGAWPCIASAEEGRTE